MVDKTNTASMLHYGSMKLKHTVRSALAVELPAILQSFGQANIARLSTVPLLWKNIHRKLYTDSRSLYKCLVCAKEPFEKCLHVELSFIQKANKRYKIAGVIGLLSS